MSAALLEFDNGCSVVQFEITPQNTRRFFNFMFIHQNEITEIEFTDVSHRSLIENAVQIELICVNDEKRARQLTQLLYDKLTTT